MNVSDDEWPKRFNDDGGDGKWLINELLRSICEKYGWWGWCTAVGERNGGSGNGGGGGKIRFDSNEADKISFWKFSRNFPIDIGDVKLLVRAKSWI